MAFVMRIVCQALRSLGRNTFVWLYFFSVVLVFDALDGPRHSVDQVTDRLQSLEDAVDRWMARNCWEISAAMQSIPSKYEGYLNTSLEPQIKALEYEEKAVSMMFPRYRSPGATGLEYSVFMARCNELKALWTGRNINKVVVDNTPNLDGAGLDRFRALLTRLNGVAKMARGIRSVTMIDKKGNFMNPAGQLTAEKEELNFFVKKIGEDFEFEISLMRFIAAHPIACEQHFRGLLPQAVQMSNVYSETILGIVDLLCPLDEGNAVTEFLSLNTDHRLIIAA